MTGIGIVVPARNEERLIGSCLRSILRASYLAGVRAKIVVVDDGSTDETASIANRLLADADGAVLSSSGGNVGAARRAGVRKLLACEGQDLDWIATTDADTEVPKDWLARQIAHRDCGADGVAGLVNIDCEDESLRRRFAQSYSHGITPGGHPHVHGANLGFRVASYLAVGGFAPVPCSEDNDLWHKLRAAGYHLIADSGSIVRTSARLKSRTEGGFATNLRALVSQPRSS